MRRFQPRDIAALTAGLVRGDEAAYRRFYEGAYFPRLLGYLLVVTGGREDAAREALQATLLRVVRHIKRFESEETFWSWLAVLARSSAVDEHRKQRRYLGFLDRFFETKNTDVAAASDEAERRLLALLEKNLTVLSPDDRDLIERKYYASQPVKQIALALQATEKAVEVRLVRARRKLKESILAELKHE